MHTTDAAALLLRHHPRCSQSREARRRLEASLSLAALALPGRAPTAILEPLR